MIKFKLNNDTAPTATITICLILHENYPNLNNLYEYAYIN